MKNFFLRLFTWWNGTTLGTQLWTWRKGEFVGEDKAGNRYFRTRRRRKNKHAVIDRRLGFERRWVQYNGLADASRVPAEWHGWLHHTVDTLPNEESFTERPWHEGHQPNLTGTPGAYRPPGSTLAPGRRPRVTGDYRAWRPGE
jgi:NADH:ubiquinone oxidoreductase subunit